MNFLLDENVHIGLSKFLSKLGHEVKLSPKSIPDKQVFKLSQNEKRVLISRDSDFLDKSFISAKHFGILILRIPPRELESQQSCTAKLLSEQTKLNNKAFMLVSANEYFPVESSFSNAA